MICTSKFRWSTPLHTAVCSSSCTYSQPLAATPPQTAKHYGYNGAAAHSPPHKKLKAALPSESKVVVEEEDDDEEEEEEEEEEVLQVVSVVQSNYNRIFIVDTPKSRLLILDRSCNVHSMLNKDSKWTGSYWDEFAALPPLVPRGPIAIFGLGGGTAAHLMLHLWPSLQLEGWEIDGILIDKSRDHFGLLDLEKHTTDGGVLNIHIGDVFSPEAAISGGYAGIIVDLFAEGKILPQLEQAATWLELSDRLMPGGRFMVNCGGGEEELPATNPISQNDGSSKDGLWKLNATIRALCEAFPGQVNWKKTTKKAGENYMALTGFLPDLTTWSADVPDELKSNVNKWRACTCAVVDGTKLT